MGGAKRGFPHLNYWGRARAAPRVYAYGNNCRQRPIYRPRLQCFHELTHRAYLNNFWQEEKCRIRQQNPQINRRLHVRQRLRKFIRYAEWKAYVSFNISTANAGPHDPWKHAPGLSPERRHHHTTPILKSVYAAWLKENSLQGPITITTTLYNTPGPRTSRTLHRPANQLYPIILMSQSFSITLGQCSSPDLLIHHCCPSRSLLIPPSSASTITANPTILCLGLL